MPKARWGDFTPVEEAPAPAPLTVIDHGPYIPEGMFEARFTSRCADCGGRIGKGEPAGYMDDEVVCEDCWEPYEYR